MRGDAPKSIDSPNNAPHSTAYPSLRPFFFAFFVFFFRNREKIREISQKIKPTGGPLTKRLSHCPADCLGLEKSEKLERKWPFSHFYRKKNQRKFSKKKLPLLAKEQIVLLAFALTLKRKYFLIDLQKQR